MVIVILFIWKPCLCLERKWLHPWNKSVLSLRICNTKIKHFMHMSFISKIIKFQHHWGVFSQDNPKQRSHELVYLTSLMAHVKSLRFFQLNAIDYPTSSSSIPKWPNLSWTYWQFIFKHGLFWALTFVGTSIIVSLLNTYEALLSKKLCLFWRFKPRTHIHQQIVISSLKIMFNHGVSIGN
jgi:hypothetical protein